MITIPKLKPTRVRKTILAESPWYASLSPEDKEKADKDEVLNQILSTSWAGDGLQAGLGRVAEFESYFPGSNKLDEDGNWILVKDYPPTEFTVPPLSVWFATPWGMDSRGGRTVHRVKILTPKGELGLFPHEYSKISNVEKFLQFVGDGMEIKFFGGLEGVPKDALFYLRSRGISKQQAITMLLSRVKSPEVCYLVTSREICEQMGFKWPTCDDLAI